MKAYIRSYFKPVFLKHTEIIIKVMDTNINLDFEEITVKRIFKKKKKIME